MNLLPKLHKSSLMPGYVRSRIKTIDWRWCASKPTVIDKLKESDGVPEQCHLIYRTPQSHALIMSSSFCSVSAISWSAMTCDYFYDRYTGQNAELVEQISQLQVCGMGGMAAVSIIALFICRMISIRIYNHETKYVAITPSAIPLMTRTFYFEKGDIRVFNYKKKLFTKKPEAKAPFFFKIKSTHLCLSLRYFQKPAQFYDMFANSEKFIKRLNLN